MTEHDIEERVKSAFTSCVPNVLDNILSKCDQQKGSGITMTKSRTKTGILKLAAGIAAALVLVLAGVLGIHSYQTNFKVASTVSLDVNPSIEIQTNLKEKVLAVNALNEDGKIVIGEMELKGNSIDVVVNALVGSMVRNGYLNDASNSILLSVCGENSENSSALQEKLTREIDEMLKTDAFSGAVLSQTISPDSELQALADSYGISLGKARLIRQVAAQQPDYSLEELSGLTINELNLMSEVNGIDLEEVQSVGNASDKAYIGIGKAKEAAFTHAGVSSESDVSKLEIEMDYEHGIMIYEVSFIYNGSKYNYDIDACSGAITEANNNPVDDKGKDEKDKTDGKDKLPSSTDTSDDGYVTDVSSGNSVIGTDRAKEIAFAHAGVSSESNVSKLEIETDEEHGITIYEVSFFYNNYKYNYDIDASTGNISEAKSSPVEDKGHSDLPGSSDNTVGSGTSSDIGINAAKETAFAHAGVSSESSVSKLEIETDDDHGITVYEVSFVYNDCEFEYEINAGTGEIIKAESDHADGNDRKPSKPDKENDKNPAPDSADFIGETAAKEAALSRAGLNAGDITEYKCETYVQKGTSVYKIKFVSDDYEYICDVNAVSGEIIKFDSHPKHSR